MLASILASLLEWLASYFIKKHEASTAAHVDANAPVTKDEEISDIDNLPSR